MHSASWLLALSGPFILWTVIICAVLGARIYQMQTQWGLWRDLPERERKNIIMLPCLWFLFEWIVYQRVNFVTRLVHNEWRVINPELTMLLQLIVVNVSLCGLLWVTCCTLLGERVGFKLWKRFAVLGVLCGLSLYFIYPIV